MKSFYAYRSCNALLLFILLDIFKHKLGVIPFHSVQKLTKTLGKNK